MYRGMLEDMSFRGKRIMDMNREQLYDIIEYLLKENEQLKTDLLDARLKGIRGPFERAD